MTARRLTREAWLNLALNRLAEAGPEALKLDPICAAANVTRGSFYHHFSSHDAFLLAVASLWRKRQTDDVVAGADPASLSDEALSALTEAALSMDFRLEIGIRELARREPGIARLVDEADAARLSFSETVYRHRHGADGQTARRLAMLEYGAFLGTMFLKPDLPRNEQRALSDLFDQMIDAFMTGKRK